MVLRLRPAQLAVALAALIAAAAAVMVLGADRGVAQGPGVQPTRVAQGVTVTFRGRLGYGRVYDTPRRAGPPDPRFGEVNPEPPDPFPPVPATVLKPAPALNTGVRQRLDGRRRLTRANPAHPRIIRSRSALSRRAVTTGASARAQSANDFTIWRNEAVSDPDKTLPTLGTQEPSWANDRNAILFTGNRYAAVSPDNGITWKYVDPDGAFDPADGWDNKGGFCCDQIAFSIDRGGSSLVLWLQQYYKDDTTGQGLLRLIVYDNREELLSQEDFCVIDFEPDDFGSFPLGTWFDFNNMSATKKYLYISSKVEQASGGFIDGLVFRIPIDQLADDERCAGTGRASTRSSYSVTAWTGDAAGFNPTLVQQDPTRTRMYWASHCKDDSDADRNENQCSDNSQINITSVGDQETEVQIFKREISKYALTERGTGNCAGPSGADPCDRMRDRILTGYRAGNRVGWFWNVKQDADYPFPHVRGAVFETGTLDRVEEPDLWNPDHAVMYPAVTVNADEDIALATWTAGGGDFTQSRVALVDGVGADDDWAITNHLVMSSDSGANPDDDGDGTWGDYQTVRPYGDCTGTFGVATFTMQGGTDDSDAEPRFAWFGRESRGCADLTVVDIGALPLTLNRGDDLFIAHTTRNIGSGTAGESTTRFYLSRDAAISDDDVRLTGSQAAIPASGPGVSQGLLTAAEVQVPAGTYRLIGCADDREAVSEISNTNNCLTLEDPIVVQLERTAGVTYPVDVAIASSAVSARVRPGAGFSVRANLLGGGARRQAVTFLLAPNPNRPFAGARTLGTRTLRAAGTRRAVTVRLTAPRGLAPRARRQYLVACPKGVRRVDRCAVSASPLYVLARQA